MTNEERTMAQDAENVAQTVGEEGWCSFNEMQLWHIFLTLDQPQLVEPLKTAQQNLANQAKAYGNHRYGWDEK